MTLDNSNYTLVFHGIKRSWFRSFFHDIKSSTRFCIDSILIIDVFLVYLFLKSSSLRLPVGVAIFDSCVNQLICEVLKARLYYIKIAASLELGIFLHYF